MGGPRHPRRPRCPRCHCCHRQACSPCRQAERLPAPAAPCGSLSLWHPLRLPLPAAPLLLCPTHEGAWRLSTTLAVDSCVGGLQRRQPRATPAAQPALLCRGCCRPALFLRSSG